MKKTYVKPEVYFESFELSANIAAGCVFKTNHDQNTCAYKTATGRTIFLEKAICEVPTQDGSYNSMCYHHPTDDARLFSS